MIILNIWMFFMETFAVKFTEVDSEKALLSLLFHMWTKIASLSALHDKSKEKRLLANVLLYYFISIVYKVNPGKTWAGFAEGHMLL